MSANGCDAVRMALLAFALVVAAGAAPGSRPPGPPPPVVFPAARYGPERPLWSLAAERGLLRGGRIAGARVVVFKADHVLEVHAGDRLLKAYRIELGRGRGPKRERGDGKTPEGEYRVCEHRASTRYHRALLLSYPGPHDAAAARAAGRIDAATERRIVAAERRGKCPPQDTPLGGQLLLHGQHPEFTAEMAAWQQQAGIVAAEPGDTEPATLDTGADWTLGCIALANPDIRELYDLLPGGTPVSIRP